MSTANHPRKNPYIGPRTFTKQEGDLFFGREREARDLTALVASEKLVLFYAQSGAGKSSLIYTRLIPELEKRNFEVLPVARVSGHAAQEIEVEDIYIYNLYRSLLSHEIDTKLLSSLSLSQFLDKLNEDEKGYFYDESLTTSVRSNPEIVPWPRLLIIDQFEELFSTNTNAWRVREDLFCQLAEAMQKDRYLWIVLVMREDYIAALDPYCHLMPGGLRARYYMQRLSHEAAIQAVRSPVKNKRPYAEGVAEKLVEDLSRIKVQKPDGTLGFEPGQYIEPVQLQVVCYSLWEGLSEGKEITEKDLQDVGDVNQSLGKYYDRRVKEVAKTKEVDERLIRDWIGKKLITTGGIRSMVLQQREAKPGELADDVIQALQSDLVRAETRSGVTWYELTHDRLVEPILENNRNWDLENSSPFRSHAVEWEKKGKKGTEDFLSGPALSTAKQWAVDNPKKVTEIENEYLEACSAYQQKQEDEQKRAIQEQQEKQERELQEQRLLAAEQLAEEQARAVEAAQKLAKEQARAADTARLLAAEQERSAHEQAKAAQRSRRLSIVAVGLALIAFIAFVFAIQKANQASGDAQKAKLAEETAISSMGQAKDSEKIAKQEALISRSRELSARALDQLNNQPVLAMLLGIEAFKADSNPQTQAALFKILQKSSPILGFIYLDEPDKNIQIDSEQTNGQPSEVKLSPDGKVIAILDQTGVKLLDLNGNRLADNISGPPSPIYATAFSPDGKILASSAKDGSIILWDTADWKSLGLPLTMHTVWVNSVAFSPDGKILASASDDQTVILWDISNPENPTPLGEPLSGYDYCVADVAFSPDGKTLATSQCSVGTIVLWDITNPSSPQKYDPFETQDDGVYSLAFSQDGKTLVSGSLDGSVVLWDVSNPQDPQDLYRTTALEDGSGVYFVAFSPDNKTLVSGYGNGGIIFWKVSPSRALAQTGDLAAEHGAAVNNIGFSPDGKFLATAGFDGKLILWDLTKGQGFPKVLREGSSPINSVEFNPEGGILATGIENGTVGLWDMSDREKPTPIPEKLIGNSGKVEEISFTGDGKFLILRTEDNSIIVDTNSRQMVDNGDVLFEDPDGRYLVFQVYDLTQELYTIKVYNSRIGKWMGAPIPGKFKVINTKLGLIVTERTEKDGNTGIDLWNINTDKHLEHPIEGYFLGLSPDGTLLAYSGMDDSDQFRILDVKTNQEIGQPISGTFISFSPTNNLVYSNTNEKGESEITTKGAGAGKSITGNYVSISPNYPFLLYQTDDRDGNSVFNLYNVDSGDSIGKPFIADSYYAYPEFSPDGRILSYQTYESESGSTYYNFIDTTTGQPAVNRMQGDVIESVHKDGDTLVYQISTSDGQKIIVLDIKSGTPVVDPINGQFKALLQDGKILIYQDETGIKRLDLSSGSTSSTGGAGEFIGVTPDGNTLLVRNANTIQILNLDQNDVLGNAITKNNQNTLEVVALSPDGNTIASFNGENIVLQNAETGERIGKPFNEHAGELILPGDYVTFSSNNNVIAIGSYNDKIITVWDMDTKKEISKIPGYNTSLSPDGKMLAAGNPDTSTTTLWNLETKEQTLENIPGSHPLFSPDGKYLAVGDYSNTNSTTLWDVEGQKQLKSDIPGDSPTFSPDGKFMAVGNYNGNTIALWDTNALTQIDIEIPGYYASFSPDRKWLAAGNYDTKTITLWDLQKRKPLDITIPGEFATFSPDGKFMTASNFDTTQISLWDLNTLSQTGSEFPGDSSGFSPDGKILVVGNYNTGTINLIDLITMKQLGNEIPGDYASISRDGQLLATVNNSTSEISIWEWNQEKQTFTSLPTTTKGKVTALNFSNDGKFLASLGVDGLILTDLSTQQKITGPVSGTEAAFNPSRKIIAVTKSGDSVSIMEMNGIELGQITGSNPVFSPDGSAIATMGQNDTITLWNADTFQKITSTYGNEVNFSADSTIAAISYWRRSDNQDGAGDNKDNKGQAASQPNATAEPPRKLGITLWKLSDHPASQHGSIEIPSCPADSRECNQPFTAISPDNKTMAYSDGVYIYLWDIDKGSIKGAPTTTSNGVTALAFIEDGQYLLSVDESRYTSLWIPSPLSLFGEPIPGMFPFAGS